MGNSAMNPAPGGHGRSWDAAAMAELLLDCGRRALAHRAASSWTLKSDGSLVTEVDRDIEALLSAALPGPGEYFIGEETIAQRGADYAREALRGSCCWSIRLTARRLLRMAFRSGAYLSATWSAAFCATAR